jgi:hypothetical protein
MLLYIIPVGDRKIYTDTGRPLSGRLAPDAARCAYYLNNTNNKIQNTVTGRMRHKTLL